MPTSNDTRVRVDGCSKIIASVLPSSGLSACSCAFCFAFMATLAASMLRSSLVGSREIEEMAERLAHHPAAFFNWPPDKRDAGALEPLHGFLDLGFGDDQAARRNRTTLSPAPTVSSFWSRSALTRSPDGTTALTPISRPSPRTSDSTAG